MFYNESSDTNITLSSRNDTLTDKPAIFEASLINILLKVLYTIIISSAVTANAITIYLLVSKKVKSTNFTMLLYHLLTADIMSALSLLPYVFIDVHKLSITDPITGSLLCWSTIGLAFFYATGGTQIFFVCFISVFRLFKVKWPLKADQYFTKSNIQKVSAFGWVLIFTLTIPNIISWKFSNEYGYCQRNWPVPLVGTLNTCLYILMGLIFPAVVFMVSYTKIKSVLMHHKNQLTYKDSRTCQSTGKIIRLLRILFVSFVVCWTPLLLYFFLATTTKVFPEGVEGDRNRMKVIRIAVLVASMNTLLDPLFFFIHLKEHRVAFKNLIMLRPITKRTDYL